MELLKSDVYHRVNRIRTTRESGKKRKSATGVPGSKKPKQKKAKDAGHDATTHSIDTVRKHTPLPPTETGQRGSEEEPGRGKGAANA